jgi:hypothetical protein
VKRETHGLLHNGLGEREHSFTGLQERMARVFLEPPSTVNGIVTLDFTVGCVVSSTFFFATSGPLNFELFRFLHNF